MNIGKRIREIRTEKGLSQKALGKLLGISQQLVAQYENGNRNPKPATIRKIARALDVKATDIVPFDSILAEDNLPYTEDYLLSLIDEFQCSIVDDYEYRPDLSIGQRARLLAKTGAPLKSILKDYETLNTSGQKEAAKRVKELTYIPEYRMSTDEKRKVSDYPVYHLPNKPEDSLDNDPAALDPEEHTGLFMAAEYPIDEDPAAPAPDPDHSDPEDQ